MKDRFIEVYLKIISEARNEGSYKLYDIVGAVSKATNGFRASWDKEITRNEIQYRLNDISNKKLSVDEENAKRVLEKVKSYFSSGAEDLSDEMKRILAGDCSNADVSKYNLNYVAFNIWLAMKNLKAKEIDLANKFSMKDKVELTLVVVSLDESAYKKHYRAFGNTTEFFIAECEDYPGIDFKVTIGAGMPKDIGVGEKVKISGTVSKVDQRNVQVCIGRAKVIERLGQTPKDFNGFGESGDDVCSKNTFKLSITPKELLAKMKEIANDDNVYQDCENLVTMFVFDSKEKYLKWFDFLVKICPKIESIRADAEKFYDELNAIPEDQLPSGDDWMDYFD